MRMALTPNPLQLYTAHHSSYQRFIRFVRYEQGLSAFFRESDLIRSGQRVLDAGCGTGALTLALRNAMIRRFLIPGPFHAFDLTPAMLEEFRSALAARSVTGVELAQCDVLKLHTLPESWKEFDLIVSASMLEYVPRDALAGALARLRSRLKADGEFVLFMTRRNWLTRLLIGAWWESNLYRPAEIREECQLAGFTNVQFHRFSGRYSYLNLWGFVLSARNDPRSISDV